MMQTHITESTSMGLERVRAAAGSMVATTHPHLGPKQALGAAVDVGAPKLLRRHVLPRRRLHLRRGIAAIFRRGL